MCHVYGMPCPPLSAGESNGYAAELSATEARRLAADPAIASVEQDRTVHADATQSNAPWGLDRVDQSNLPLSTTYTYPDSAGSGVTVYVLDTGVRISHAELSGRASYGYDFVDNDTTAQDGYGHGTHVATTAAGTTYGVAKKAKIVAVRVLGNDGSGTTAGVIAGPPATPTSPPARCRPPRTGSRWRSRPVSRFPTSGSRSPGDHSPGPDRLPWRRQAAGCRTGSTPMTLR